MKNKFIIPIKIVISTGLLVFLFLKIDIDSLRVSLATINFPWLAVMLILPHLGILISTFKWQWLLGTLGISVNLLKLFNFYLIGTFFNNFLPGMVGGDLVRIAKLAGDSNENLHAVTAATFAERLIGVGGLITFICLIQFNSNVHKIFESSAVLAFCLLLGYLTVFLIIFRKKPLKKKKWMEHNRVLKFIADFIKNSHSQLVRFRMNKKLLFGTYLLSLTFYFVAILTVYAAGKSLQVDIKFEAAFIVLPLVLLVGMLPVAINGLGLTEASYVFFFHLLGLDSGEAFSIALLLRSRILVTGIIGGILFVLSAKHDQKKSEITETERRVYLA
jgi:uncharacterized protein (TIRG00374 family)